MFSEGLFRKERPPVDVYILSDDGAAITEASQVLSDDVNANIRDKRAILLAKFGVDSIPGLKPEYANAIESHLEAEGVTVAPMTLIDPEKDGNELFRILGQGFVSEDELQVFTGWQDASVSPGGSAIQDIVLFHDWRARFADTLRSTGVEYGFAMDEDEIERVAGLQTLDFVMHELVHTAGGLMVNKLILKENNKYPAGYQITNLPFSRFQSYGHDLGQDDEELYTATEGSYHGPVFDEGLVANYSADVLTEIQDTEITEDDDRFMIYGTVKAAGDEYETNVSQVLSAEAGFVIDKLARKVPEVSSLLSGLFRGHQSEEEVVLGLKKVLPLELIQAGLKDTYAAWEEFDTLVDQL